MRCCFHVGILLLASACAQPPAEEPRRADFACGEFRFSVRFQDDTAIVSLPHEILRLPLAVSASGARYSDGTLTYWEHQGTARLELADTVFVDCERIPA